jgi:hypothetical protein
MFIRGRSKPVDEHNANDSIFGVCESNDAL